MIATLFIRTDQLVVVDGGLALAGVSLPRRNYLVPFFLHAFRLGHDQYYTRVASDCDFILHALYTCKCLIPYTCCAGSGKLIRLLLVIKT